MSLARACKAGLLVSQIRKQLGNVYFNDGHQIQPLTMNEEGRIIHTYKTKSCIPTIPAIMDAALQKKLQIPNYKDMKNPPREMLDFLKGIGICSEDSGVTLSMVEHHLKEMKEDIDKFLHDDELVKENVTHIVNEYLDYEEHWNTGWFV